MEYKSFLRKLANTRLYVIPALDKAGFKQKALNMYECGAYKDYLICTNDYTSHFNGFNSCKDRFCPLCQEKRSRLYFAKFVPVFKYLLSKGYYVNMLNFTITDTYSLKDGIKIRRVIISLLKDLLLKSSIKWRTKFSTKITLTKRVFLKL